MWLLVSVLAFSLGWTGAAPPSQGRIMRGWECPRYGHGWQAVLYRNNVPVCSGVLVHSKWVLTAARCQDGEPNRVAMGIHEIGRTDEKIVQWVEIEKMIVHKDHSWPWTELFRYLDYSHDLMLLRLKENVRFTTDVYVLDQFPTKAPQLGTRCIVSSWDFYHHYLDRNVLTCAYNDILPDQDCNNFPFMNMTKTMFCAGDPACYNNVCWEDTGAPLVCDKNVLQGILTSNYFPCHGVNRGGMFTNIFLYVDWIRSTIRKNTP